MFITLHFCSSRSSKERGTTGRSLRKPRKDYKTFAEYCTQGTLAVLKILLGDGWAPDMPKKSFGPAPRCSQQLGPVVNEQSLITTIIMGHTSTYETPDSETLGREGLKRVGALAPLIFQMVPNLLLTRLTSCAYF